MRVTSRNLRRPNKSYPTPNIKSINRAIIRHFSPYEIGLSDIDTIPARYDQIQISLYSRLPIEEVKQNFVSIFGEPKKSYDGKFWLFSTPTGKFEVSRYRTTFFHIIKLRNMKLLSLLAQVVENFASLPKKEPVAKLASAEIAFDVPLPANLPYVQAEKILKHLSLFIVPVKNRYASMSIVSGSEFQDTADGAENGKYTLYVGKHRDIRNDEQAKTNKRRIDEASTWKGIVYLKAFYGADGKLGPWHIRFEVELSGKALKRIGGNYLPFDEHAMKTRLAGLSLSNFWRAYEFDWKRFIDEAQASYERSDRKRIAAKLLINLSGEIEPNDQEPASKRFQNAGRRHYMSTHRRKRGAYRIARLLNDEQLIRKLWKNVFISRQVSKSRTRKNQKQS